MNTLFDFSLKMVLERIFFIFDLLGDLFATKQGT
jgi:hypothetical protein